MCYMINTNDLYYNIKNNHLENPALMSMESIEFNNIDIEYMRIFQEIHDKERSETIEHVLYIAFWLCVFYVFILELLQGRSVNVHDLPM